ncbi:AMP-binding protein [Amycolatopsis sp. FDAARGOS 1241]|uniref:AMP-binding protein n=1 Tax=Amycolatopsis sp. FDAARGOS 1241 TaxID=2778070 RepID=UPI0019522161|nr:AMP-binding protein [Amycolatopsis sp. FDAARGOS 1241]QRP49956.1 AMP-binding protein [Amycolatopsis sp. FDAARGOS 1241]
MPETTDAPAAYTPATELDAVHELTVGTLLRTAADQAPNAPALVEGVPDPTARRRWTYAQLLDEAEQAARALLGRFEPGEHVAAWANNIPEWILLEMAAALAGLTLVTVNPALREDELRHVLGQSEAAGVFLVRDYRGTPMADILSHVRADLPHLREAVLFEDWPAFRASGTPTQPLPDVEPGDPAQIQYTSGTTGVPKGAILNHRGITNNARLSYCRTLDMRPGENFVNPMPLFHTAGCVLATLAPIATLGTQVLMPWFDPGLQLALIEQERGVVFGGVPTMLLALLGHPAFPNTDLSSVRYALSGGVPVPPALVRRVEAALGVPMSIIYAQTEASPGITMTRLSDTAHDRAETLGRPLPACEVKIIDPATGGVAARGETGELCTRGYHVMTGYHAMPEQTAEAIDTGAWLHTGDLARMNERGYLTIEGRVKEMIIRGGENIYPREIEHVLLEHPAIADVAVIGIPDPTWGEQVGAFIVLRPGADVVEQDLIDYVRDHLAPHKTPKVWQFVTEFPLTGSGKIRKHVLRDHYLAAH